MNEKPSYGNDYFGVTAKDMEHSFGIESSEAQTVKDNFQYDKPPAIVHESDFGKVFVWLETLANKKGYASSDMKQTVDKPGDDAFWMSLLTVPDKKALIEYFSLLDEYRSINPSEIDLVTSTISIEIGSENDDVRMETGGEVIVRDGRLIVPNDTMSHMVKPLDLAAVVEDSPLELRGKVEIPEEFREIYEDFYKQLTHDGISLVSDDKDMLSHTTSQLCIQHRVKNETTTTTLSKKFCVRFEQVIAGNSPQELKYVRMKVTIDVNKPELLNLKQLRVGMTSEEVLDVLNGYVPLPKD